MTKLYSTIDIPVKKRLNINSGALSVENAQSHVTAGSMLTNRKCRSKFCSLTPVMAIRGSRLFKFKKRVAIRENELSE